MKEKTKKNIRENFEMLLMIALSGAAVYQMHSCTNRGRKEADSEQAKVTSAAPAKDTLNANNARIEMIKNANTKAR